MAARHLVGLDPQAVPDDPPHELPREEAVVGEDQRSGGDGRQRGQRPGLSTRRVRLAAFEDGCLPRGWPRRRRAAERAAGPPQWRRRSRRMSGRRSRVKRGRPRHPRSSSHIRRARPRHRRTAAEQGCRDGRAQQERRRGGASTRRRTRPPEREGTRPCAQPAPHPVQGRAASGIRPTFQISTFQIALDAPIGNEPDQGDDDRGHESEPRDEEGEPDSHDVQHG